MSSDHGAAEPPPFTPHPARPRPLLIAEGAGIGPAIALAERLVASPWKPLVLLGSDEPFPFRTRPSVIIVPGIPTHTIACMPLLEEWGIPSRLASSADLPGCFDGRVTALAATWLSSLDPGRLSEVEIFAAAAAPASEIIAALARQYDLPHQFRPA